MCTTLQFHRSSDENDQAALIREMMALDRELYRDAQEQDLGNDEYWRERFARCPESLSLARQKDGRLAGYYQFLPVTPAFRDEIVAGRAHDGRIPLEAIIPYGHPPQPYHLYLCSMAVRTEWHRRGVATRLYREEVAFQERMSLLGWQPLSLVSVVWSPCGARFFERLKLPLVGRDDCGRPIHERVLSAGAMPELPLPKPAPERVAVPVLAVAA
ncbi:MAG: GNAT family N-acetyltransferase [Opitutaceae bacterium]